MLEVCKIDGQWWWWWWGQKRIGNSKRNKLRAEHYQEMYTKRMGGGQIMATNISIVQILCLLAPNYGFIHFRNKIHVNC